MSAWGGGLNGFASGLNNGLALGQRLNDLIEQDQIAKVREQGLAEAKAMQAKATPQITDNGDMQNLKANPQASQDPNLAPQPVNTDLAKVGAQPPQQSEGMQTYPVSQPQVQDASQLGSQPLASAAPGAQPEPQVSFANGLPQQKVPRFNVGGQGFDTQEEAAAYVKKQTPALTSFYKDSLIPKMTEALIAQGKPDQAAAWQKYADEDQTRTNMGTWGKAVQLAQFGDYSSAAQELFKLHPHFDDGLELVSTKETKGPDGQDGFTMTLRDENGKEQQVFHDAKTITEFGLSQLSPIEMFNKRFQRQAQADTLAAKERIDERNDGRTATRQLENEKARDAAAAKRQDASIQANKDRDEQRAKDKTAQIEKAATLRAKNDAAKIEAGAKYQKSKSPEERRAIVVTELAKDPLFKLAPRDEQEAQVENVMSMIKGSKPAQTTPNPMEQGLPQSRQQAPAGKIGVDIYDPTTGKMRTVYR